MASPRYQRRRRDRRIDVIKVKIEDVNLNGAMGPMAQGRDPKDHGLFDIDLTQSVGGAFPTPAVGEVWWIKRGGRLWILDRKVDSTRTPTTGGGGGGDRAGVPANVDLFFTVREKKTALEYNAAVTFDAVTTDENGDPQDTSHYIINWVPCTKDGNIITDEKVRQHTWNPNDDEIDDVGDPAEDYYVILPGNVPRPKIWYWKGRVRAVSEGGRKGEWSDWCEPSLPIKDSLPEPPAPGDVDLVFKWKDTNQKPIFSAVVKFDDVNYWDIPGFDYEDDVTEYEIQLQPIDRTAAWTSGREYRKGTAVTDAGISYICIKAHTSGGGNQPPDAEFWYVSSLITPGDGFTYVRADPQGDGEPWEIRRKKVKDKDDDDTWVALGTLGEDITEVETTFNVDETGVVGVPAVPFVVLVSPNAVEDDSEEKWLVTARTLVAGSTYTYEVYRQFGFTPISPEGAIPHSTGAVLKWLKDPFRYKVDFHNIERPRTVYWRTRARSKDRFSRIGPWSSWTLPVTPWSSIDFEVPVPLNLKADIEIRDYKTHPEFKLVARFRDPAPNGWNIPGGDLQDDLHHYLVVAEALINDPDGYIEGTPPFWDAGETYVINDIVEHEGGRYRSIVSGNTNNEPPNGAFWVTTTDQALFRVPDRRIGVLENQLDPAETSMTVTLDANLPPSITRLLSDVNKRAVYMRVETEAATEGTSQSEVVVTTDQTAVSGQDRTYTVERMQKGSGNWGHNDGDVVYLLTEHLRRAHVDDKDKDDPGHFNAWYTVNLGRIAQPKRFYWHVRARSVDNFGHKSEWTRWTQPISPSSDPDLIIDAPDYVALNFDRVHRSRWNRWRAIVEFDEVHYTAPDGDREEDVARYAVQLASTDGDELDVEIDNSQVTIYVIEKRRSPDEVPFFILIDDESMEVTARVNVADNLWAYTVERAQRETTAAIHPDGARVYEFPFQQQSVSAKSDDDRNQFNRVVFPRAQKFRHYKARVRAIDRYNRRSDWTDWTPDGTPSDNNPPPEPTNVLIDVDNHKIVANWDYGTEPDDTDPDLQAPSDDVAYFQVQLSDDNFATIFKKDRYVADTRKVWRVKKPGTGTFYIRVRAVDGSGNKSDWVSDSGAQNGVPTPNRPVLTFDTNEVTKNIRALVLLQVGVTGIDDDVDGYEFQLQPAEFKRLSVVLSRTDGVLYAANSNNLPPIPFVAAIQKERIRVTNANTTNNRWQIIRGIGTSVAAKHRKRTKIQFFRNPALASVSPNLRRQKTGEEAEVGDPVLAIFHNIQKGMWYRARVRAHDTKGNWGNWSEWSR